MLAAREGLPAIQLWFTVRPMKEHHDSKKRVCAVSGLSLARSDGTPLAVLRPSIADRIRADHPGLANDALISHAVIDQYRARIVEELLTQERGELSDLEHQVIASLKRHDTLARNIDSDFAEKRTFGEHMADNLASFGGSWGFIILFVIFMGLWILANVASPEGQAVDPFPFILLNLLLSCLAALQAPVIMMSQKRQETKDRLRAQSDYRINLKAELEIRHLHEKLDHLLNRQWERLAQIQRIQIEMLEELNAARRLSGKASLKAKAAPQIKTMPDVD